MAGLLQAWRMTWRDWRAGELYLMMAVLVVAVAAVTSVGFLADRLRLALERDGAQLLGADVVLNADAPAGAAVREAARSAGLRMAETLVFPSMALAGDDEPLAQLVSVKAVTPGYPLRGTVQVRYGPAGEPPAPGTDGYPARDIPAPGTVWLEPSLLPMLGVAVGDTLTLGDVQFRVGNVITLEPDRGIGFVNLSPRLLMRHDDLAATGLVTFGSRVSYHTLFAGNPTDIAAFTGWLADNLERGQRIETLASGRPEIRRTLDRAQHFLALVAVLAVMIAAVALVMSARRYMLRHIGSVAIMRCLGATQGQVTRLMATEFLMLALAGAVLGCLLGYAGHLGLLLALRGMISTSLPAPSLEPALQGLFTGVWLLLGFALPSLARLRLAPPARVLRSSAGLPLGRSSLGYLVAVAGFILLLLWVAGNVRLGVLVSGGFLAAFAVFAMLAWLGLTALGALRRWSIRSVAWRFALAGLVRRKAASTAQICALAMGLMAILLLAITRTDLVEGWRMAVPPDAPNRFLINIQNDQKTDVEAYLHQAGIQAVLHPMVRGRLVAVNGETLNAADFPERRARRFIDRESNMSYSERLPAHNRVVAGGEFVKGEHEVSMDVELAEALRLQLGDVLTYEVADKTVAARLSSLRTPEWDSMAVNFFVVTSPEVLHDAPQTWLSSFHVAGGAADPLPALVARFPNLSVFNVSAILQQMQGVLDQAVVAVQGLFVFALAAGMLVLYAALSATRDERTHETALLRALGATQRQLARAQWLELGMLGFAAGVLAAASAALLAMALARFVFQFDLYPGAWVWAAGIGGGVAAALLGGQAGLRGVLRAPPIATLRDV